MDFAALESALQSDPKDKELAAGAILKSFGLSRAWIAQHYQLEPKNAANVLLKGSLSAAVEVGALGRMGVVRSAIFSLRTHYELALSWLFYCKHPIEWEAVASGREQLSLPGENQKFYRKYFKHYEDRWNLLKTCKTRKWEEPYSIMSGFVHGSYPSTLPFAEKPEHVVFEPAILNQLPDFVSGVAEYVSDCYLSAHSSNWLSMPDEVRLSVEARLPGKARDKLAFD